jgi:hypothetical protein
MGMRNLVRTAPLLLAAIAVASATPSLAAQSHRPKPACAVPRRWRLVAGDAQVVLIRRPDSTDQIGISGGEWRYCTRSVGRFALLVRSVGCGPQQCSSGLGPNPSGPINLVDRFTLSQGYVAYRVIWSSRGLGEDYQIRITDTAHGRTTSSAIQPPPSRWAAGDYQGGGLAFPSRLLLSRSGVAAWKWTLQYDYGYPRPQGTRVEIRALSARTGHDLILDSEPVSSPNDSGDLANLRLDQCVAGCVRPAAVVAWTHAGVWRYARVA